MLNDFFLFATGSKEYCGGETFTAACNDTHQIYITQAQYGIMHTGKCAGKMLTENQQPCSADENEVLDYLDETCATQKHCELAVNYELAENFKSSNNCPKELQQFLEVEYQCIPGKSCSYQ